MLLSNCVVCNSKKSKNLKQQEVGGLLSSLEIKTLLRKIPLVSHLLFKSKIIQQFNTRYKTDETVNKFLLA